MPAVFALPGRAWPYAFTCAPIHFQKYVADFLKAVGDYHYLRAPTGILQTAVGVSYASAGTRIDVYFFRYSNGERPVNFLNVDRNALLSE